MLVTYPFPQAATGAVQGDYTNLRITADLDLRTILTNLNGGKDPGLPTLPPVPTVAADRRCPPACRPRCRPCSRPGCPRLPAGAAAARPAPDRARRRRRRRPVCVPA